MRQQKLRSQKLKASGHAFKQLKTRGGGAGQSYNQEKHKQEKHKNAN